MDYGLTTGFSGPKGSQDFQKTGPWGQLLGDFGNGWVTAWDIPQLGTISVSLHARDSEDYEESFGHAGEEKIAGLQ